MVHLRIITEELSGKNAKNPKFLSGTMGYCNVK